MTVEFLNEFISHTWVPFLSLLVMHIYAPITEFPELIPHRTVARNVIDVLTIVLIDDEP